MIGEVGSSEDGGNKAQWINDMSTALQSGRYPDLKMVVYFDQDKEELWSGTSSPAAQTAFTSWVNQTYMKGTGTDLAQVAAQYKGTATTAPPTTTRPPTTTPPDRHDDHPRRRHPRQRHPPRAGRRPPGRPRPVPALRPTQRSTPGPAASRAK